MTYEPCVRCGAVSDHAHHRKLRSQGGEDSPENLVRLCFLCHDWVHSNPAEAYEAGLLVKSWDDPATAPMQLTVTGEEVPHEEVVGHTHDGPSPGSTCTTCKRRIPYPKKKTSPTTKVVAIRVPLDDVEAWEEALDAAARHLGVHDKPHHKFHTLNAGLVLILQGEAGILG